MKKFYLLLFILTIGLLLGGKLLMSSVKAQPDQEVLVVRVGSYDNKPKIWQDENGISQGLFPDILNEIARREGWEIKYVHCTWDECLKKLEVNEIDIMPDVALSDERQQLYDFNEETILANWGVAYTRDDITIDSALDLKGKRIAILKGGIHYSGPFGLESMLKSFDINAEIIDVKEYAEVFELLEKREVDIGVVNRTFGIAAEKDYAVKRTNLIFNPTELRFAFTKGAKNNTYLISRIDDDLRQMKEDNNSVYHKSLVRHLGGVVEKVEVLPRWAKYAIFVVAALFVLFLTYLLILQIIKKRLETLIEIKTKELREEKENFQTLFEESSDSLVLMDPSTLIVLECNAAAWKTLGFPDKNSMVGKRPPEFSASLQGVEKPIEEYMQDTLAEVNKTGRALFDWISKDANGKNVYLTGSLSFLEWNNQRVLYSSLRDVTSQRENQDKIIATDRLKSRFITILTHIMRTPLSKIRWSLESLESGDYGEINSAGRTLIRQMLDSEEEILRAVSNISLTLDIERNVLLLEKKPASLVSLVKSIVKQYNGLPQYQNISWETDFPTETPAVFTDQEKISLAIVALVDNAVRFSADGETKVAIKIEKKDNQVRLSVSDTGIGIPQAEQQYTFDRFFRGSNAILKYPNGMGLGLYIAKAIVESHGGSIGFKSEEGRGSTFWMDLPLTIPPEK